MSKEFMKIKLPLVIYIFLLLFAPPIIKNVNLLLVLATFSGIALFTKYRKEMFEFITQENIKRLILVFLIYCGWYLFSIVLNILITKEIYSYNYLINLYSIFLVIPISFLCCLHIILYTKKHDINTNEILKYVIIAGLIQAGIAFITFICPPIKRMLIRIMYFMTGDSVYLNQFHVERRFFGFANNMLDSFGFGTGILAVLPLFYSIKNGRKWLWTVPVLFALSILNSRTGLVVFGIGFLCWLAYIIKAKKIKEYTDIFIYFFVIIFMGIILLLVFSPKTIQWIFTDILSFFTKKSGTADVLFSTDFWTIPPFLQFIFGSGTNVAAFGKMIPIYGFSSDVGYINEIWKTGMIGLVFMSIAFACIMLKLKDYVKKEYKWFVIFLIIAVFITNIKFYVLCYNPGTVIILLELLMGLNTVKVKKERTVKEKDLISIIIPVYNVEKYVERCIKSVVAQTYKKIEIILVNDGSKDNSEAICLDYAKKDKRIVYVKQKNGGLSAARNKGMEVATGAYYVFIDSDDYVNTHYVEELYRVISETGAMISICDFEKVDENSKTDINYYEDGDISVFEGREKFLNLYNENGVITIVAWNKMYDKRIFEDIKYPKGKLHEDEFIIYDILNKANKVAYTNCSYYYYLQRSGSITSDYKISRTDVLEALKHRMNQFKELNEDELYAKALFNYYYQLVYHRFMIKNSNINEPEIIKSINEEIIKYEMAFFNNSYISAISKVKMKIKFIIFSWKFGDKHE